MAKELDNSVDANPVVAIELLVCLIDSAQESGFQFEDAPATQKSAAWAENTTKSIYPHLTSPQPR